MFVSVSFCQVPSVVCAVVFGAHFPDQAKDLASEGFSCSEMARSPYKWFGANFLMAWIVWLKPSKAAMHPSVNPDVPRLSGNLPCVWMRSKLT